MEIKKTAKFVTDFLGSAPAIGAESVISNWIQDKQTKWLESWASQQAKKGENAHQILENILSIFHRNGDGKPILGNWMLRRCLIITGQTIFNAQKDKTHPKKGIIPMAVQLVEPIHINLFFDGKLIERPHGVKTFTVTVKGRSFFKAYEYIKAGSTFEATMFFDDELLGEDHIDLILQKAGSIGVGAFRERYGKFEWV